MSDLIWKKKEQPLAGLYRILVSPRGLHSIADEGYRVGEWGEWLEKGERRVVNGDVEVWEGVIKI